MDPLDLALGRIASVSPFRLSPDDAIDPLISLLFESNALGIVCFPWR
jgi:hypothetical protein